MQQISNHIFLDILHVPHTDLWSIKGEESSCKERSTLCVLYSDTLKVFILRIGHTKIALDRSLQVVSTFAEKNKFRAYLIPTPTGFYMIKVMMYEDESTVPVSNFETILENTCNFVRKSGLESKIMPLMDKTFESIMEGLHHAGESLSKKFTIANPTHPNQYMIRPFETLIDVQTPGVAVVDISSDELKNLCDEAAAVGKSISTYTHWKDFTGLDGIEETVVLHKGLEEPLLQTQTGMNVEGSMNQNTKKLKNFGAVNLDKENVGEVL